MSIEIEISSLTNTFKLDEMFSVFRIVIFYLESLTIPYDCVGKINDVFFECLIAVEGIGKCHLLPLAIIK